VRIWDVNPGYLNRQSLLGEHRELHAIVSIIKNKKTGYSRHPETLRWQGFGWALSQRHRLLAAEMNLRGFMDRSPARIKTHPQKWPQVFVDSPASQFSILEKKYISKEQGRIPLPRNVQALWAQHQYSVMARDDAEYKYLGGWVASQKSGKGISDIYPELVSLLRCPPSPGNLTATIAQMREYVRACVPRSGNTNEPKTPEKTLKNIQRLAFLHNIAYLKESTALGELPAWMRPANGLFNRTGKIKGTDS
jgi:hypothetical protein